MDEENGKSHVVSHDGPIRVVKYDNSDYEVIETGKPTSGRMYTRPVSGQGAYRAVRKAKGDKYGTIIVRVYGQLGLVQNNARYNPEPGDQMKWMSRRLMKGESERIMYDLRFGEGGTGEADEAHLNFEGDQGEFPNTFLKTVSEMTGWNWDTVETFQVMSEPNR